MSRTCEGLSVPIPRSLPGVSLVTMVGSVTSISQGEVRGDEIYFVSGPTWFQSPLHRRKVFFMIKGDKPEGEATLQEEIVIRGVSYEIYLEVDQYNRE